MNRTLARLLGHVRHNVAPVVERSVAESSFAAKFLPLARVSSSRGASPASYRLFSTAHLAQIQPKAISNSLKLGTVNVQRRGMFIQTQTTPNPNSLMFVPGRTVMETGSANFANRRDGMKSPLASKLFENDGISAVFFGSDFVTVTKVEDVEWTVLKPEVFASIMDFFASDQPIMSDADAVQSSTTEIHEDDSEIVQMIKELLDTRIRPAVQEDGGDIAYHSFDEGMGFVYLKMQGACATCPSSSATLKNGIENMLMHYIPEVKAVMEQSEDDDEPVRHGTNLDSQLSN